MRPFLRRASALFVPRFSRLFVSSVRPFQQIKRIFDDEEYWSSVVGKPSGWGMGFLNQNNVTSTGLFKNPYLDSPEGLQNFTNEMLGKAESIVNTLITDSSPAGLRNYIRNLDTLSDILCKVIDLCEFIRISHPNKKFLQNAEECYEKMFNYMNLLNTNLELYRKLDLVLKSSIRSELSEEEVVVGELLLADFKKSGIDQDSQTRNVFIDLSGRIATVGQHFNNNAFDIKDLKLSISKTDLQDSLPKDIFNEVTSEIGSFSSRGHHLSFHAASYISMLLLKNCSNESIRQQVWNAINASSDTQIQLLELMLNYRKLLSIKLGYPNFNEYQLTDKMAKSPKNVLVFLQNLETKLWPHCISELRHLTNLKIQDFEKDSKNVETLYYKSVIPEFELKITRKTTMTDDDVVAFIRPWDREYLVHKHLVNKRRLKLVPESLDQKAKFPLANQPISNFFSLGTVLSNLSVFLSRIYGIKFKLDKPLPGEIWHSDVRKLLVVNSLNEREVIGIIYLDLFERTGKSMNPAHFTIVCSRKITDKLELGNCAILNENSSDLSSEDVKYIQCYKNENGDIYQLPIITLVCNFSKTTKNVNNQLRRMALLRLLDVETLLHEIGHLLHSMLGKTDLHNVSGTRCLTDFVELPSILMETFGKDPRVLQFLGEHFEEQFDKGNLVDKEQENKYKALLIELHQSENDVLKYCDIYSQLKMAYLDQQLHLHTPDPVLYDPLTGKETVVTTENKDLITEKSLDQLATSRMGYSEALYHQAEANLGLLADVQSTWYGKFGHLFTYGATYYTYLFDRAISSKIYEELFLKDPFASANGAKFKNTILKWGGSKNPWTCIGECLDEPRLKAGNEDSMKLVGKIDEVK